MTSPLARNHLRIPGTLIKDPTDLSAASPYGGTELGNTEGVLFRPSSEFYVQTAEEWGSQPVDVFHGGYPLFLGATLRGLDNDALAAIFPDTVTASPSGETSVRFRVTAGRAGTQLSTLGMILLFEPRAALRHKAIILRDAIPVVAEDAEIALSMSREVGISVVFYGRPDSSNRVAEMGLIGDLAL